MLFGRLYRIIINHYAVTSQDDDPDILRHLLHCIPRSIGKDSMPKIIINDTINLFLKTTISILLISSWKLRWPSQWPLTQGDLYICATTLWPGTQLLISNHNSFRVPFDKIASVYFIWKRNLHFNIGNGQPREQALCQLYRRTSVPYCISKFPRWVRNLFSCTSVYETMRAVSLEQF